MKPLDFVRTPKGNIAMITEMNYSDLNVPTKYSISFIGTPSPHEKDAWWFDNEGLQVLDNLPSLLARNIVHPFGTGMSPALDSFPMEEKPAQKESIDESPDIDSSIESSVGSVCFNGLCFPCDQMFTAVQVADLVYKIMTASESRTKTLIKTKTKRKK